MELFQAARKRKQCDLSRVGFKKQITQIAAITETGNTWYSRGPQSSSRFLAWLGTFESCRVYALNIQYDLGNLFGDSIDVLDVVMIGGRMIKARWKGCTFLDVYNVWPMSVKKLGKAFKLRKRKFDTQSKEYVFRDVEIIRAAMLYASEFLSKFGVEHVSNTLGGFCVNIWKSLGGENWHDSSLDEDNRPRGFYGGRVELFSMGGTGLISYTDINSLYPFCMTKEFPECNQPIKSLDWHGVARVKINIPDCFIAPLPVRRNDGSIFYPVGTVTGFWTLAEIRNAVEHGARVLKVFEAWGSKQGEAYYKEFVTRLYALRLKAKSDAEKLMLKLCMNNLYGQLATSGSITRSLCVTEVEMKLQELIGLPVAGKYGSKKLAEHQIPLPEHTNYLHAAHVTSFARLELQKYLRRVRSQDLVYCDTDSVLFFGNPPFPISNQLGKMKLEGTASSCRCIAPKTYQFGETWKAKGVRATLAKEFIQDGEVTYEQPFKFREAVTMFDFGNAKKLSIWHPVTKHLLTQYDKKRSVGSQFLPLHYSRDVA